MTRLRYRRTQFLLSGYAACLLGIGLALFMPPISGWVVIASWIFMGLVWRKKSFVTLTAVILAALVLGWWRGAIYGAQLSTYHVNYHQSVVLQVTALEDGAYGAQSQMSFTAGRVILNGQPLAGKIAVSGFGMPAVLQGDVVTVAGKLSPGYGAYQGRISYGRLSLLSHHAKPLAVIRRKFSAGIATALPEPLASFSMGLLVGQRATLPAEIKRDLLMVGLTHIIAVSGYNLTILLNASKRLLRQRSKRISLYLSLLFMGMFVMVTGGSASIVRAAIVSLLSLWANYFGRTFKPTSLICLAATVTGLVYPYYVWGDMSWYLSFLAFYGVMAVSPLVSGKLSRRIRESVVVGVAIESISAEVMTLPFILHYFGQMSLVSLPANVLVVALVPIAMLVSFIAGLGGVFAGSIAGWLAWPAKLLLNYMLDTAHLMAGLPHVFLEGIELTLGQMLAVYGVVFAVVYANARWQTKRRIYATITDKKSTYSKGVQLERA